MVMKIIKLTVLAIIVMVIGASILVAAQQEASVEKGKALFNDPQLGTSGKTCNSCHISGKGLEKAGTGKDLENTINACITTPLKGKALDVKSIEMKSLVLYIKSLVKPAIGC